MAFRFNFPSSQNVENTDKYLKCNSKSLVTNDKFEASPYCGFIPISRKDTSYVNDDLTKVKIGPYEVVYISKSGTEKLVGHNETLTMAERTQLDVLPGIYEGGFKIWECSLDLAHFLSRENCIHPGTSVLELGCGAGLPGIFAYLCGATVTFQDFNRDVLECITLPNVLLNTVHLLERVSFLSGDWEEILSKFYSESKNKHDVILTSETIYNVASQKKLLRLMKQALKPSGIIYLAAKIHYFGVGGGIQDFEELLQQDGTFNAHLVHQTKDGVERQILRMTFKQLET